MDKDLCPCCGSVLEEILPLEYTDWWQRGDGYMVRREALPDDHPASVPSLYREKYGVEIPATWRFYIED